MLYVDENNQRKPKYWKQCFIIFVGIVMKENNKPHYFYYFFNNKSDIRILVFKNV